MAVPIPETYQYDRPIPKGQAGVTQYRVADPVLESNAGAQALASVGQEIGKVQTEFDKWGERLDTTAAQEALNKLRQARSDLTVGEDGFVKYKAGDVINRKDDQGRPIFQSYPERFKTQMQTIGEGLSPRARMLFNAHASNEQTAFASDVAKHGLSESEKWDKSVHDNTVALKQNQAIANPDSLGPIGDEIYAMTLKREQSQGRPGEAVAFAARSNLLTAAITMRVKAGDPSAIDMFEKYGDKLDANAKVGLTDDIKTLRIGVTAKSQAADFTGGAASVPTAGAADAGVKTSMKHWTADGYSAPVAAGMTAGFLRESQFSPGARNPRDGRDGSDSINIGQWNSARATAFKQFAAAKGLDPNSVETGLAYAKAEIDGVIPYSISGLSPGFKTRLMGAKSEKEAADLMTREYFRPKHTEGESAIRQGSASAILKQHGDTVMVGSDGPAKAADPMADPLFGKDNTVPAQGQNGPAYKDTRQMLLDADRAYDAATRQNMTVNATDERQRRATQAQLDLNLAGYKRQVEIAKLDLELKVDEWMTTGGGKGPDGKPLPATERPPPAIWNQLSYEKQKSIDATLVHNAGGKDATTDWGRYYEIQRGLTSADPNERAKWAAHNLMDDKPNLAKEQFSKLADMQGTARKGDPEKELSRIATNQKMIDERLNSIGIKTGDKATPDMRRKEIMFNEAVQARITQLEKSKPGHKATYDEVNKILRDLTYEVTGSGDWVSRNIGIGDRKRAFEVPNPDPAKFVVKMSDISKSDLDKIGEALKAEGIKPTEENIIKRYKLVRLPAGKP